MNDDYNEKDNLRENEEADKENNLSEPANDENINTAEFEVPYTNTNPVNDELLDDENLKELSRDENSDTAEFDTRDTIVEKPVNQNNVYYGGDLGYTAGDPSYNKPKKRGHKVAIAVLCSVFGIIILATALVLTTLYSMGYIKKNAEINNTNSSSVSGSGYNLPIASNPGANTSQIATGELTIPQISKKLSSSVVSIIVRVGNSSEGLGTGIIIKEDGYIVTNAHVIENSTSREVILSNGKSYSASVVGSDSKTDLAIIKIDATGLFPAQFGDSDNLEVGETVVAIGNPYGLEFSNTVTHGIVSAIRNDILMDNRKMNLIQTDAQINPGNSGGPLVNTYGQVIGINSLKIMSAGGTISEGLGFAIPSNTAKPIIEQLINTGYIPNRPMIGITGFYVDKEDTVPFDHPAGIYVQTVDANSDAAAKGIEPYDIITKINGKEIASMNDFLAEKENFKVNESITLTVWHAGKTNDVKVTLVESKS